MQLDRLKQLPLHPYAFALFPILALLAHNIREVNASVAVRPVYSSLGFSLFILLFMRIIFRNWQKAALAATLTLLLFFSYGHAYKTIREIPNVGIEIARHRYFIFFFPAILISGYWAIYRYIPNPGKITYALNITSLILLVFPTYQVIHYTLQTSAAQKEVTQLDTNVELITNFPKQLPDIYFIVLDSYTRADAMLRDLGYDNTPFLNELQDMGFYVADCSRSNYDYTHASITSALNLNYIPNLQEELIEQGLNPADVWILLKQSLVRRMLENLGYITIAFESGFEWSRIPDADIYLEYTGEPYEMQTLTPFESMLIKSTALLIWADATYKTLPGYVSTPFSGVNFPIEDHVNRQLFILDQLPKLAHHSIPKFVFAHILIPHVPYIFGPSGEIITDPAFFAGEKYAPYDHEHLIQGYTNEIEFINQEMIDIFVDIISESDHPPIIILMGDHGLQDDNRLMILNAYYVPENIAKDLYPEISPVNSFRIIFNGYFNTEYSRLADLSFKENRILIPETSPICVSQ